MDVDNLSVQDGSASNRTATDLGTLEVLQPCCPAIGHHAEHPSVRLENRGILGVTEARSVLRDRVQDRLDIGRRLTDHPQDLGRRGLLLVGLCFSLLRLRLPLQRLRQAFLEDVDPSVAGLGIAPSGWPLGFDLRLPGLGVPTHSHLPMV